MTIASIKENTDSPYHDKAIVTHNRLMHKSAMVAEMGSEMWDVFQSSILV